MSNNIKKRTDLLTPQLLKTPIGRKVTYEFLDPYLKDVQSKMH